MASLTSSILYGSPVSLPHQASATRVSSSSNQSFSHTAQVLCQQLPSAEPLEQRSSKVSRRSLAVATVLGVVVQSHSLQEAHAARKKTAEGPEKKPQEDKSLSAYDAKLLATYRRKEAMKEAMAKQKAKASKLVESKRASLDSTPAPKPEAEAISTPQPDAPAPASVAASAPEAVKEVVDSVLPSAQ